MKKLLIVNDCELEKQVLKNLLSEMDKEVVTTDEFKAYSWIKKFNPDVIIANLIMEKTTGDSLIFEIKKKFPNIKCILSSSNPISLADYKDKKVDAVLQTPINSNKLGEILKEIGPHSAAESAVKSNFSFCPHCGEKLGDSFVYCPHCGEKL